MRIGSPSCTSFGTAAAGSERMGQGVAVEQRAAVATIRERIVGVFRVVGGQRAQRFEFRPTAAAIAAPRARTAAASDSTAKASCVLSSSSAAMGPKI